MNRLFVALLFLAAYAIGCEDTDLVEPEKPPVAVPPMIGHAPDAAVPTASALIQAGMRSCCAGQEQQPGEVVVHRWVTGGGQEPWYPNGNLPSNSMILQANGRWPNLNSPVANWYSGAIMADNIEEAWFYVPSGFCAGFKPYAAANYINQFNFLGNWVCRAPWQNGENWLLWNANWLIHSMKTALIPCGSTYCAPPADF